MADFSLTCEGVSTPARSCLRCRIEIPREANANRIFCSRRCNEAVHTRSNRCPTPKVIDTCPRCDAAFPRRPAGRYGFKKYCSDLCRSGDYTERKDHQKVCPVCDRVFVSSQVAKARKTCSDACYVEQQKVNSPRRLFICQWCGKEFGRHRQGHQKYCSRACAGVEGNRPERLYAAFVADNGPIRAVQAERPKKHVRRSVYVRDRAVCQLCFTKVDMGLRSPDPWSPSIDHIVPASKGGGHDVGNLQLTHLQCNSVRGDRDVVAAKWASGLLI